MEWFALQLLKTICWPLSHQTWLIELPSLSLWINQSFHEWHKKSLGIYCLLMFASLPFLQNRFDHPYISFLFYGMDAAGDFIPVKQLREKYNRPRHEIPIDPEDE